MTIKTLYLDDVDTIKNVCFTDIDVFLGDDYDDVVKLKKRNKTFYRYNAQVDGEKVLITGLPYEGGGAWIFVGTAKKFSPQDLKVVMKREGLRTVKLLKEHDNFVIELPLESGNQVFRFSLEGAEEAIEEIGC